MSTQSALSAYKAWLRSVSASVRGRARLTTYRCAAADCGQLLQTLKPFEGDFFDSLSVCPYCDYMCIKVVLSDGTVEQRVLPANEPAKATA